MQLGIRVDAGIAYDDQPIIQIAGVANGRQHDAAGVNTGEHQRVDAVGAQQRLQVGANERADAVLDYDRFWSERPSPPPPSIVPTGLSSGASAMAMARLWCFFRPRSPSSSRSRAKP